MASQLIAALIGGALTQLGNFLTYYLSSRKDREQWSRSQESEARKWEREEQHRHRQELYDIYSNCLRHLSLIIAECRSNPGEKKYTDEILIDERGEHQRETYIRKSISENEKLYRHEAQKWLWLLLLHVRDFKHSDISKFQYDLHSLAMGFSSHLPECLMEQVLELAKKDNRLLTQSEGSEQKNKN